MALLFGLSAECGPAEADATALAEHFAPWGARTFADPTGNWWCHVVPDGVPTTGIASEQDAAAMTTLGHALYDRLRSAPPSYRYALAGVEADEFRRYAELREEPDPGQFPGLVLADPLWEALGRPDGFVPFAAGYRWIPYAGERFAPVTSAPR
jgi:hypothetical protein